MADGSPLLAAVIVTRNEAEHVATAIESVRRALGPVDPDGEILVVDSQSTDCTIEIARRLGARVIGLSGRPRCCAALGRHVGARLTRSRYVLFLDGDSEIDAKFVREAVDVLEREPRVVAVGGRERQIYLEAGCVIGGKDDYFAVGTEPQNVPHLGGNGLYRRHALEAVGGFHPFMRSWEEAELGARLRRAGGAIVRVPTLMALHRTPAPDAVGEYWRRLRNHLLTGQGQALRVSLGTPMFWEHAQWLNRVIGFFAWMALGLGTVVSWWAGVTAWPVVVWMTGSAAGFLLFVYRSRSLTKPIRMLFDWAVCGPPLLYGFILGAPGPDALRIDEAVRWDSKANLEPRAAAAGRH